MDKDRFEKLEKLEHQLTVGELIRAIIHLPEDTRVVTIVSRDFDEATVDIVEIQFEGREKETVVLID